MPMEKIKPANKHISVCHVTTAHARTSSRVFDKFCKSAETDGYNVTYLVADGGQNETLDNVNIIALPKAKNRLFRFFVTPFLMVRTARALKADIYQLHDPELLLSALFFRKKKNIVLFDFHEDYPLQLLNRDYLKFGVKKIAAWLVKNIQFFISKRLDGVIAATSTIGQKFVNRGIKTQVIRNLPKSEFFDREYVDWAQRENWIVHVGTLTKDRGIEELVDALPLMKQKARLKLCGVFSDPQFLAHLKTKDGWQYVDYLGFLDRGSVAEIVSHSKAGLVTLHPARNYMEALPIKLFEYMSLGTPVISSDFPIWAEIVNNAGCGLLVNPQSPQEIALAADELLTNIKQADLFGKSGRKAVISQLNWNAEKDKASQFYLKLLADKR